MSNNLLLSFDHHHQILPIVIHHTSNRNEEAIEDTEAMASGGNFQFSLDMTQWNEIKPDIKQYGGALKLTRQKLQRG